MKIQDKHSGIAPFLLLVVVLTSSAYGLDEIKIICRDSLCTEYGTLKNENTVACIVWKDRNGLHFLGIDQIETGRIAQAGFSSKLTAYSYEILSKLKNKESWRIKDFSPNAVTRVSYLQNTLSVTDIDNDGIAETCFLYCISGDCCDPWPVKLMLHKNNEKLAIRGKIPITEEDIESYQKNFDPAYEKYKDNIRAFASAQWDRGIRMHCKSILGDSLIEQIIATHNKNEDEERKEPPPNKEEKKNQNGQHILQQR